MTMPDSELEINVPSDKAGRIVGKGGKTLKEITRRTGARLDLSREERITDTGSTRALKIFGPSNSLNTAVDLVNQIMNSTAPLETFLFDESPVSAYQQQSYAPLPSVAAPMPSYDQMGHMAPPPLQYPPPPPQQQQQQQQPALDFQSAKIQFEALLHMHPSLASLVPGIVGGGSGMYPAMMGGSMPYGLGAVSQSQAVSNLISAKRRRMDSGDDSSGTCSLLVPSSAAGTLIGKAGSNLKHLTATTGAKLTVEREEIMGDRLVTVLGTGVAQVDCVQAICNILQPNAGEQLTIKFLIPDSVTGVIVGKKGAGLSAFKKDFGVGVDLPREDIQGHRVLSVSGVVEGIHGAAAHVINVLGAPPQPR